MNSTKSRRKRAKKILHLQYRKASSVNKSCSYNGITAGYKKRISTVLKNNKLLASALQESYQELSCVKKKLNASNESLHKMIFFRNKMQLMHSSLKTFIQEFEDALHLIEQDIKWPTLECITKSHKDLKTKRPSGIDSIEEMPETDNSIERKSSNFFANTKTTSDLCTSTPVASNSSRFVENVWADQENEAREKIVNEIPSNKTVINYEQQNSTPKICVESAQPKDSAFSENYSKTPVLEGFSFDESNGRIQFIENENSDDTSLVRERDCSKTPELSISMLFVSNNNFRPIKSKNDEIPRFHDLSASINKMSQLSHISDEEKVNETSQVGIPESNFDIYQKAPCIGNLGTPIKCTLPQDFDNKCNNQDTIGDFKDLKISDIDVHKKIHITKNINKKSGSQSFDEIQNSKHKTVMKKICCTNKQNISSENKKDISIVRKSGSKKKVINNQDDNLITAISTSNISNNIILSNNTNITSHLDESQILSTTMSFKSTEKINNLESTESVVRDEGHVHMISTEEPLTVYHDKNLYDNCFNLAQRCNVPQISAEKSQEDYQHEPEIRCNNDLTVQAEMKNNESPTDVGIICVHNKSLECKTFSEKEKEINVHKVAKTNLNENISNTVENKNGKIDLSDKTKLFKTSKSLRKSLAFKTNKRISYLPFSSSSSSDSEKEEICDFDFDFCKEKPVKELVIRKCISKNKPPKLFTFNADKRRSSFIRDRKKKLNSIVNCEDDIPNKSNDENVKDMKKQSIQNRVINIKEGEVNRKSVRTETDICKKKSNKFSEISELPEIYVSNKDQNTEDSESNENVAAHTVKAKVCHLSDVISSVNDQPNIIPPGAESFKSDKKECIIMHNQAKNTLSDVAIQIQNESKEMKCKRTKRKRTNDQIPVEDFISKKKSRRINTKEADKLADSEEISAADKKADSNYSEEISAADKKADSNYSEEISAADKKADSNYKYAKKEGKGKGKKILNKDDCKNLPHVNLSPCNNINIENKSVKHRKSREMSIVLNDAFQTDISNKFKVFRDKELLQSEEKNQLPTKFPLSDNSSNVQSSKLTKDIAKTTSDSNCLEEIKTKRRRAQVSYKEQSLAVKLRR